MVMGRPRKPGTLHILEGTHRRDRHGDPAAVESMNLGEPVPPKYLKGWALRYWHEITPRLREMKCATAADSAALAQLCTWWAAARRFTLMLEKAKDGDKRLYRLASNLAMATNQFQAIACRFGLTPSDRAKLRVGVVEKPPGLRTRNRQGGAGTA